MKANKVTHSHSLKSTETLHRYQKQGLPIHMCSLLEVDSKDLLPLKEYPIDELTLILFGAFRIPQHPQNSSISTGSFINLIQYLMDDGRTKVSQ